MKHLHIRNAVPPHRVEELLDRIHRLATVHGTLDIANLIDEYREDVYIEITYRKDRPHGRTHHEEDRDLGRARAARAHQGWD